MSVINTDILIAQTLGFTVAMAWSGAVDKIVRSIHSGDDPNTKKELQHNIMYAIITTILIVVIVYIVNNVTTPILMAYNPGFDNPSVNTDNDNDDDLMSKLQHGKNIDIVVEKT